MIIKKYYLTKNPCYSRPVEIKPTNFMLHSTGANNPTLKRYVQPDDGFIGINKNGNHWNRDVMRVMVHGFIGKDKDGVVRAYQTLPYNYRAWHSGGKANDTHVAWEICEDDLTDKVYFDTVYNMAVYVAYDFCKTYKLDATCIIDHSEGHAKGIASNHGDVKHWFSRFGKTMDDFRADVKKKLDGDNVKEPVETRTVFEIAKDNMVELGITDGSRPKDPATREEVWVMLDRLYKKLGGK